MVLYHMFSKCEDCIVTILQFHNINDNKREDVIQACNTRVSQIKGYQSTK